MPAHLPAKNVSDLGLLGRRALLGVFFPLRHIYELFNSTHHSMESFSFEPIFLGEKTQKCPLGRISPGHDLFLGGHSRGQVSLNLPASPHSRRSEGWSDGQVRGHFQPCASVIPASWLRYQTVTFVFHPLVALRVLRVGKRNPLWLLCLAKHAVLQRVSASCLVVSGARLFNPPEGEVTSPSVS